MFPPAPATELELTPQGEPFLGELFSPSPFHFRFTGEDALEIASYNSQSGVRVAVQGRMWDERRGITPFAFSHVPNTDRSRALERFGIANGYLLNVVVFAASGSPRIGQTFVSLHVTRGQGTARYLLATLLQGYVTAEQELAFPGSPVRSSLEGGGYTREITGTDPAAGSLVSEVVPSGARWRVRSIIATLTTSATAGNRQVFMTFDSNGGTRLAYVAQTANQPASTGWVYTFLNNLPLIITSIASIVTAGLPDITLNAGAAIGMSAQGILAGDDFGAPVLTVEEWLEAQ